MEDRKNLLVWENMLVLMYKQRCLELFRAGHLWEIHLVIKQFISLHWCLFPVSGSEPRLWLGQQTLVWTKILCLAAPSPTGWQHPSISLLFQVLSPSPQAGILRCSCWFYCCTGRETRKSNMWFAYGQWWTSKWGTSHLQLATEHPQVCDPEAQEQGNSDFPVFSFGPWTKAYSNPFMLVQFKIYALSDWMRTIE